MPDLRGLYTLPPGVDFAREVVAGLMDRMAGQPPEALARVTLHTNTRRMQRRLREVFVGTGALLLPRIVTLDDLALSPLLRLPLPVPALRRRLELTQLVAPLTAGDAPLAPRSAIFALADSLAALLDEMEQEGVGFAALEGLDVQDQSGHWARAQRFLAILGHYLDAAEAPPGPQARMRAAVLAQAAAWAERPPEQPVIVAGSTGSRGATALFIEAVARLPSGAVILPGYDEALPEPAWREVAKWEEHPQHRLRRVVERLELQDMPLPRWTETPPPRPARNRLISLALRPAPVTDAWLSEGPMLGDLAEAAEGLVLLEAADPRAEAEAIALRLRAAVEAGQEAALISPDRMLTRRVTAALGRWNLVPDDSAGVPLQQTPPGRFLRHVAGLMVPPVPGAELLALLKHPLCRSGGEDRGSHLRRVAALELHLRRHGPPWPGPETLAAWVAAGPKGFETDAGLAGWGDWLARCLAPVPGGAAPLGEHLERHRVLAERLASGGEGSGGLWDEAAGRAALKLMQDLAAHAEAAGAMEAREYQALFDSIIARAEVRQPDAGHPLIRIWGTLEARVQSAEVMILAALNEGSWPEAPPADPWLNRRMRAAAGLTSPERRIGLSAHDFQQAAAAREVWLTRSLRSDDAETVPSRWLSRLTSLMAGLPATGGPEALAAMRGEGARWLAEAARLARPDPAVPVTPLTRPAPAPPTHERPTRYSVSSIARLYTDPYAVYAGEILRLRKLDPLVPSPDARLRGEVLHKVFERFIKTGPAPDDPGAAAALLAAAEAVLEAVCPWPATQRLWLARIARGAENFLAGEVERRRLGVPVLFEQEGRVAIDGGLEVTGKADRIDLAPDGRVLIYDYKTGEPPAKSALKAHEQQLAIEAALMARGGWPQLGPRQVIRAAYLSLKPEAKEVEAVPEQQSPDEVWAALGPFLRGWMEPGRGYRARRWPLYDGDFDHLSRFGEWDETAEPAGGAVR